MRTTGLAVAALVVVLAACSPDDEIVAGCTAIGSLHGLGVDVPAEVAPISDLELSLCVAGACTDHAVTLDRGTSTTESPTCEGTGDDAVCSSGEMTFDGSQFGFVTAELPAGPVEVSGSYRAGGREVALDEVTVPAEVSYPNGKECGADGTQAGVVVRADGLHER